MRLTTQTLRGLFLGATCGFVLAAAGAGCGGDPDDGGDMNQPPVVTCTADKVTGSEYKYATNALKMPKSSGSMTYASDIDGDGKTENQLKVLVQAVSVAGLNIQDPVSMAVADGDAVILADLQAPDLATSSCSSVTLALAKSPAMGDPLPKFDGSDKFTIGAVMGVKLFGKIDGSKLSTTASKDQTADTEQRITLMLPISAGTTLPLSIRGVHIEGTLGKDANGQPVINDGMLNGVISKKDIDSNIVPTVATLITGMINSKPADGTTMTIIGLFENMANKASSDKCTADMTKCCHTNPATCVILPAEVLASPVGGVLMPDVQALDDNDSWKPVAGGKAKNAMSVGLGFTMIKANF